MEKIVSKLKLLIFIIWPLSLITFASTYAADDQTTRLIDEARVITAQFQTALKSELQTAMKSGGPVKAVEVCHKRAPEIAESIGETTGWKIARTSLKTRNEKNRPAKKEKQILNNFERRKQAGEPVSKLEWWEQSEADFKYMKAIPTGGVCTTCHGVKINEALKTHIKKFYPDDMATGFKPGDIRGAFSLVKTTR